MAINGNPILKLLRVVSTAAEKYPSLNTFGTFFFHSLYMLLSGLQNVFHTIRLIIANVNGTKLSRSTTSVMS